MNKPYFSLNYLKSIIKETKLACGISFLSSQSVNQDSIFVYHGSSEIIYLIENQLFFEYEMIKTIYPMTSHSF